MSTVNVDETLYLRTIEVAKSHGLSINEFVGETLRQAVEQAGTRKSVTAQRSTRNGLPVMDVNGYRLSINPRKVRESIEEEGF